MKLFLPDFGESACKVLIKIANKKYLSVSLHIWKKL